MKIITLEINHIKDPFDTMEGMDNIIDKLFWYNHVFDSLLSVEYEEN